MINNTMFDQAIDCIRALRDVYEEADKNGIQNGELRAKNGYAEGSLRWPSVDYKQSVKIDFSVELTIKSRMEVVADADS